MHHDATGLGLQHHLVIPRERHCDSKFGKFRRLYGNRPDLQPALRAAARNAHDFHKDEQNNRADIGRKGQPHPPGQRQHGQPDHHEEADNETHQLQLPEMRFGRIGVR